MSTKKDEIDSQKSFITTSTKLKNQEPKKEINSMQREAIEKAVANIRKMFGNGSVSLFGEKREIPQSISTGSLILNKMITDNIHKGLPVGRTIEIYGKESSGKTTLALAAIADAQREGHVCAMIDAEHALDIEYARNIGVDESNLIISQPSNGQEAFEIAEALVRSAGVKLIVIDSVAALVPKEEIDGSMEDQQMGLQARLMSKGLRKLTGAISNTGSIVIFINQTRTQIGISYGNPTVVTGGNALKFYASVRIEINRSALITDGDNNIGNLAKVKIVKNKIGSPFRQGEIEIIYGKGILQHREIFDLAIANNIIERKGAWYSYGETKLGQGKEKALAFIEENKNIQEEIKKLII